MWLNFSLGKASLKFLIIFFFNEQGGAQYISFEETYIGRLNFENLFCFL